MFPLAVAFAQSIEAMCSVENEDVVGAAPTGPAPTTSELSTILLPTKVRLILEVYGSLGHPPIASDATALLVDPQHTLWAQDRVAANTTTADSTGVLATFLEDIIANTKDQELVFFMLTWSPLLSMPAFYVLCLEIHSSWVSMMSTRAPSQYPKRRLSVRSRKVSKPRDLYLKLSDRSEIWQALRQQCCRCACQISKRYDNLKYQSRGFETLRDLMKRRLFRYWDGAQVISVEKLPRCTSAELAWKCIQHQDGE